MRDYMKDIEADVIFWAHGKGLLIKDNSKAQVCKMIEEVGEVAKEVLQGTRDGLANEIGDVLVTAIILAAQNDLNAMECLGMAIDKIKKRTGQTVNGTFIKD